MLVHMDRAADDVAADGFRHARRVHRAEEIEHRRHQDRVPGRNRPRRNGSRYGVRRVMEAVDEIKDQRKPDDRENHVLKLRHIS